MQDANENWMLYGAYGYTGRLMIETALARGHRPILAGRDPQKMADLAEKTGLPVRIFSLANAETTRRNLHGAKAVLHAAGPFSKTAAPMLEACIAEGVHYLDITGEIEVFEMIHAMDERLKVAKIAALPGVGFDVVPTDTLAALLAKRLPGATSLALAFKMYGGGLSPGTAKTMVENAGSGGRVRKNGLIVSVPAAYKTRHIPFPSGDAMCTTIPWGDVATAFHTTGIPNIEVYLGASDKQLRSMKASAPFQWLLKPKAVQALLKAQIGRRVHGPSADRRKRSHTELWGEAINTKGDRIELTMRTPEGYSFTAESGVRAVEAVLEGKVGAGAFTPAKAFGTDFALAIPGVELFT